MLITRNMLLYYLQDLQLKVVHEKKEVRSFQALRHPDESETDPDPDFLYVCRGTEALNLQHLLTEDLCLMVLYEGEPGTPAEQDFYRHVTAIPCELILVGSRLSFRSLMNRLSILFHSMTEWDHDMHIAILEEKGIDAVLQVGEQALRCPVILFDTAFDVLATSRNTDTKDPQFAQIIKKGYIDEDTVLLMRQTQIFNGKKTDEMRVAPARGDASVKHVYLQFFDGQTLLGYACIFTAQPDVAAGYLDVVRVFLDNMTFCMRRGYESRLLQGKAYETILCHLVENRSVPKEQLQEWLQKADDLPADGRYILAVVEFESPDSAPVPFLARMLERQFVHGKIFLHQDRICLLKSGSADAAGMTLFNGAEEKRFDQLLGPYACKTGISNTVFSVLQIYDAYRQAKAAIRFGRLRRPEASKYGYRRILNDHLLACLQEEIDPESIQLSVYKDLELYDTAHHTHYCQTVLTYIRTNGSATQTAEALKIHRNTVRNMIRFAEELCGFDVNDPDLRREFLLSESIAEYKRLGI